MPRELKENYRQWQILVWQLKSDPPNRQIKITVNISAYTVCMSGLPDMYTHSLRAAGPRAKGVNIRQTTNAHGFLADCKKQKQCMVIKFLLL